MGFIFVIVSTPRRCRGALQKQLLIFLCTPLRYLLLEVARGMYFLSGGIFFGTKTFQNVLTSGFGGMQ